jgi:hypothetical protein
MASATRVWVDRRPRDATIRVRVRVRETEGNRLYFTDLCSIHQLLKVTETRVFSSRGDWIRTSDLYVPNLIKLNCSYACFAFETREFLCSCIKNQRSPNVNEIGSQWATVPRICPGIKSQLRPPKPASHPKQCGADIGLARAELIRDASKQISIPI